MVIDRQTILDALHSGKTIIAFTKANGEKREMLCTLRPDMIPPQPISETERVPRKENLDVQAVWDLEKQAWRSFRFDSVIFILEQVA
jgi:hypothetical protein